MIDRYALYFRRALIAAILGVSLASCGRLPPGPCGCPPPPLPSFMAVAQRGANEVAIYPLSSFDTNPPDALTAATPSSTISAPGVDAVMGFSSLYVGEDPSTVAEFTVTHNGLLGDSFTQAGSITTGVSDPASLAIAPFNGMLSLFVANRGNNTITVYKGLDNVPTGFNNAPALTLSGLNAPNGLVFDSKGDLWVSQAADVAEFIPPFTTNSAPATTITNGMQSPSAVAFDWTGTMYVADKGKNAIVVYPAGSTAASLTFTNGITAPGGMYINGSYLYVANTGGGNLTEYRLPLNPSSQPIATNAVNMNQPSALTQIQ